MSKNYQELLERAFEKLPVLSVERSDFQIPEVDALVQGNKTILRNIEQIADKARRSKEEIAKYLTRELAAPISVSSQGMEISAKLSQSALNAKVKRYFEVYVICKECHKPDTRIVSRERGYVTVACEACGARYTIKSY